LEIRKQEKSKSNNFDSDPQLLPLIYSSVQNNNYQKFWQLALPDSCLYMTNWLF